MRTASLKPGYVRITSTAAGAAFATATALAWGGQFVVGKSALGTINAFPLSTVRYAAASLLWLVVLAALEGRGALRLDGRGLRLFWLGSLGFAGFNLFAYTGLAHARPQSASLIVALAPLLTALVLWLRTGRRPAATTFVLLGIALAGVFSFVIYSLGAAELPEFSPLRYTTLTAALGWLTITGATVVAVATGLVALPSGHQLWAVTPQIAYLTIPGAFVAVLTWNAAIGILGPQNAVLFGNLIPVTTFAIEIVRGYRPNAVELAGAAVTIGALVANNLLARRPRPEAEVGPAPEVELETARAA